MSMYYLEKKTLRETKSGARWVKYKYWESFGRETGYAHSWGCREKNGTGLIWLRPSETLEDAIARRY